MPLWPGIFHADRTEHLRGQIARGIEALRLFLEMNALQLQGIDALDGLVVGLARHPAERLVRAAVRQHDVVVIAGDARDERNRGGKILDFGGHGECGIDQDRHGQLVAGAVVDDAALGGQRNRALLLMSRLLDEFAVAENLQKDQAPADRDAPQQQHRAQKVEAGVLAGSCGHERSLAIVAAL